MGGSGFRPPRVLGPWGRKYPKINDVYETTKKGIIWIAQKLGPWPPIQNCSPNVDPAERPIFKKIYIDAENLL